MSLASSKDHQEADLPENVNRLSPGTPETETTHEALPCGSNLHVSISKILLGPPTSGTVPRQPEAPSTNVPADTTLLVRATLWESDGLTGQGGRGAD